MRPLALVADAHQGSLDLAVYLLELGGFRTRAARSKAEAARLAAELQPDVAVVDLNLGDPDCRDLGELLTAIENLRDVPVVVTTGRDIDEPCSGLAEANVVLLIRKPIEPAMLADQIRAVLPAPG